MNPQRESDISDAIRQAGSDGENGRHHDSDNNNNNGVSEPDLDRRATAEETELIVDLLQTITELENKMGNCDDDRCLEKGMNEKMCASCHRSATTITCNGQRGSNVSDVSNMEEDSEKLLAREYAAQNFRSSICYSQGKNPTVKDCPKPIRKYYKKQNELIEMFEEMYTSIEEDSRSNSEEKRTLKLATKMSAVTFACNLLLLLAKLVAAILSGSLVIISSLLDSAMDLVSGILMWWSNRAINNTNYTLYPRGRRKLEPVAIVVLAVIMSFVSVQLIHESVQKMIIYATRAYERELNNILQWTAGFNITHFIDRSDWLTNGQVNITERGILVQSLTSLELLVRDCASGHAAPVFETPTVVICIATIIVKLALYLVCRRIDNPSVQALAKDHFNDVISNSGAIACGLIGYRLWKYADPIGAIVISLWIIVNWSITAHNQIRMLTGYTAEPGFIKKITWLALNHDRRIQLIDSVIAFHFGNKFLVEIKVVLPGEMSMRESHDLCEALQKKIERLPEVERAFIHIDYECGYYSESERKRQLQKNEPSFPAEEKDGDQSTDQILEKQLELGNGAIQSHSNGDIR